MNTLVDFLADVIAGVVSLISRFAAKRTRSREREVAAVQRRQILMHLSDGQARDEALICANLAYATGRSPYSYEDVLIELEEEGVVVQVGPGVYRIAVTHRTVQ